jgi:hypothetical protein
MTSGSTLCLAILAIAGMCIAVSAATKRPGAAWNFYHFDGHGFVAGPSADGSPFLAVRDGAVPVVLSRMAKIEAVALPAETGALAGICYIQSSGGKLAGGHGNLPCPGMELTLSSGSTTLQHTKTDGSGYFVALLPGGVYRVSSGVFAAEATVENGTTTLVPLRTGKRMVD